MGGRRGASSESPQFALARTWFHCLAAEDGGGIPGAIINFGLGGNVVFSPAQRFYGTA
jgi:hypothetical protein